MILSLKRYELKVKASHRMSLGVTAGLLWDYRFRDLNENLVHFKKIH